MSEDTGFDDLLGNDVGVPTEEGESWGEAAERLRPDATIDLGCPEGHFSLEVSAHHGAVDAVAFLQDEAIQDSPGPCPACGAEIMPEVTSTDE